MLVTDLALTPADDEESPPGFLADSESGPPPRQAFLAAVRTINRQETVLDVRGDDVAIGVPLYSEGGVVGVVVARRRLTEVANAVEEVRRALLAAAGVGLLVAVALAVALASTLLRRLGRLRAAALRISAEGPDRLDAARRRPRRGRRPRAGARRHAGGAAPPGVGAAGVRRHRLARAAHAADDAPGHDGAARGGPARRPSRPTDAQRQVATARRELLRLSTLAEELLDLSRLDAAVAMRSEAVELGELARAVAAEFGLRAGERETALEVVPPTGPCWGRGDPDAVARVVRILIDNALRYGGGEPIRVTAADGADTVTVEVADRGQGVPPEERERIFERFYRGRARGAEGGFGLGLAIGRELAERMGGTLTLADRPGGGTRFMLSLPRSPGGGMGDAEHAPDQDAVSAGS